MTADDSRSADRSRAPGTVDRRSPPPDPPAQPAVCQYCGDRFVDDDLLALHRGLEHGSALTDEERDAYEAAVAAEREEIRLFRLKALGALLVLYFGFIFVYAFVL